MVPDSSWHCVIVKEGQRTQIKNTYLDENNKGIIRIVQETERLVRQWWTSYKTIFFKKTKITLAKPLVLLMRQSLDEDSIMDNHKYAGQICVDIC